MATVKEVISGAAQLNYNTFKDNGYRFFKPLLDVCMAYEGSGDQEDEDTVFVAVIIPPGTDKTALIMTTRRAHDRKSLEIQNIETLLSSKHSISDVSVIYSHPKDIHAILHDANSKKVKAKSLKLMKRIVRLCRIWKILLLRR